MIKNRTLRSLHWRWHRLIGTRERVHYGVRLSTAKGQVPERVRKEIYQGSYERQEAELVARAVHPGDKVLEIGMGVGFVSVLATQAAGPGNVLSFEANPNCAPHIRDTFERNGLTPNFELKAISTDGAPLTFFAAANIISSSQYDRGLDGKEITVPSTRLEEALTQSGAEVMIMDVEGAEIGLLESPAVDQLRTMILETHPHVVGQEATEAMLASLAARGFVQEAKIGKNVLLRRAP